MDHLKVKWKGGVGWSLNLEALVGPSVTDSIWIAHSQGLNNTFVINYTDNSETWDRFSFTLREHLPESFLRNKRPEHPYSKSYSSENGMNLKGYPTFPPAAS